MYQKLHITVGVEGGRAGGNRWERAPYNPRPARRPVTVPWRLARRGARPRPARLDRKLKICLQVLPETSQIETYRPFTTGRRPEVNPVTAVRRETRGPLRMLTNVAIRGARAGLVTSQPRGAKNGPRSTHSMASPASTVASATSRSATMSVTVCPRLS